MPKLPKKVLMKSHGWWVAATLEVSSYQAVSPLQNSEMGPAPLKAHFGINISESEILELFDEGPQKAMQIKGI